MPALWSVNHGARIVRLQLVESLAFDDWFATVERIAHDSSIDRGYRILVDRPCMTRLTDDFAEQMTVYFARRQSLFAQRRIEILAPVARRAAMRGAGCGVRGAELTIED